MKRALIFLLAFFVVASVSALPDDACEYSVDLIAGQHYDSGNMNLWNDADYLYVEYATQDDWLLYETHLAVECSLEDIPQNKQGSPIPGHFEFSDTHDGITEFTYMVPLADLDCELDELYVASHAVVGKEGEEVMTETAWGQGDRFVERGNWAMYFMYEPQECTTTETFPENGTAYIGYEDRQAGDFDYNDFGMSMSVLETYENDYLSSIELEFVSLEHKAKDTHDIHILRSLSPSTEYTYTITRSSAAQGTETAAGAYSGSGDLDVILFDSAFFSDGDSVTIEVEVTNSDDMYDPSATPPRFDLDSVFAFYDPWMYDRTISAARHIDDVQPATTKLPTQGYDVPYIIVVPETDWPAPGEAVTITTPYPEFDDYYSTENPTYADWYL